MPGIPDSLFGVGNIRFRKQFDRTCIYVVASRESCLNGVCRLLDMPGSWCFLFLFIPTRLHVPLNIIAVTESAFADGPATEDADALIHLITQIRVIVRLPFYRVEISVDC